jgi:hypothetical protein
MKRGEFDTEVAQLASERCCLPACASALPGAWDTAGEHALGHPGGSFKL